MTENKKTQNQVPQFENLRKLGGFLSANGLSAMKENIIKSKKALETFCIGIKDRAIEINKEFKDEKEKIKVAEISMPKVEENVEPKSTSARGENKQGNFERRNNQNANFQNRNGNTFNKPFERKPFDKNAPRDGKPAFNKQGEKPFNRNNQNAGQNGVQKPFNKPTTGGFRTTGLLPKADKSETFTPKPERNFGNKNKTKTFDTDRKELSKKAKIKMGYIVEDINYDDEVEGRVIGRVKTKTKKEKVVVPEKINIEKATITSENLTVKILAEKIGKPAVDIIKKFMMLGMMPNINSIIDYQTAELVAAEFGVTLELKLQQNYEQQLEEMFNNQSNATGSRPPIVTVMGHVDHGKTCLLDTIRKSNVVAGEAGGITQHIGGYTVDCNGEKITFIDTPGHEAFTSMRARGAKITDVAILVVAADDGIMPQTVEAINHIKMAQVPMIVAINKMDKPEANPDRVKQQLTEHDVLPEEWGGDTICVPISAKQNIGIDKLLEMVLLVSEMADLKADSSVPASGHILESKIDKGRGIVANIIVKNGTLKIGDFVISGTCSGRVKAMTDSNGKNVKEAGPSMAVSVLGFTSVPDAGDLIHVVDEKLAKNIIEERISKAQIEKSKQTTGITLEDFLKKSADHELKTLNIIIKADVKGSCEVLEQTLTKIANEEVQVACIHSAVGGVNESDVLLAQASKAIIITFNVRPDNKAKELAEKNGVDIKFYRVIYDAVDDITLAINGMLAPKFEEQIIGHVEIRQIFKISSVGHIAGSYVLDGQVTNKSKVRLLRNNIVVAETEIDRLQQQKDEAKSVRAGYECGIKLKNFNDIKVGDIIECFEIVQK